jgi:hypothetical protein
MGMPPGWEVPKAKVDEFLLASVVERLGHSGRLVAIVSPGLLSSQTRLPIRRRLVQNGLTAVLSIPADLALTSPESLSLQSIGLLVLDKGRAPDSRPIAFLDLAGLAGLPQRDDLNALMDPALEFPSLNRERVFVESLALSSDVRLDPEYYDPIYLEIQPPEGYIAYELGEIAEIRGGRGVYDKDERYEFDPGGGTPYLQVRHILESGDISPDPLWVVQERISGDEPGWAQPGDILISVAGTVGKVAIVPDGFEKGVSFDTSIRRVRLDGDYGRVDQVADFLRSEIGRLQIKRHTTGSVIPQLTSAALSSIRVFLPKVDPESGVQSEDPGRVRFSQAQLVAAAIDREIVSYLRQVEDEATDWQSHIREKLLAFLSGFPRTLEQAILTEYPAPIAIAFRKYKSAEFNPHERLQRLLALVNSVVHFAFATLVCDFARNHSEAVPGFDAQARAAARGSDDSTNAKLRLVEQALSLPNEIVGELFLPGLQEVPIIDVGDRIRTQLRNPTAHTAPASEQRIMTLLEVHEHAVTELLESLRFLGEYTLCRIRNHSYRRNSWVYQAETYKGAEYDISVGEFLLPIEPDRELRLVQAEREHIVLLDGALNVLDLHPFYQIHVSDETGSEPHLCFVKRSYSSRAELLGESVRSGIELSLPYFGDHSALTALFAEADDSST